jgi:hypothetical protein
MKVFSYLAALLFGVLFAAGASAQLTVLPEGKELHRSGTLRGYRHDLTTSTTAGVYYIGPAFPIATLDFEFGSLFDGSLYACDDGDSDGDGTLSDEAGCALLTALDTTDSSLGSMKAQKEGYYLEVDTAGTATLTIKGSFDQVSSGGNLLEESSATLPSGPNFRLNSEYAVMNSSSSYRSSMVIAPGNSSDNDNVMRGPNDRPKSLNPYLGLITHTTTGASDDTGDEICADVSLNLYEYGDCVGVDDDQNYVTTRNSADIETTCSAALGTGNAVNVYCGAGPTVTEPSYSTILGGYDNHINHQAAVVISQHSSVGPGDAGGHQAILGGASHYTEGDCEYGTIAGGARNRMHCKQTPSSFSISNTIVGGLDNYIDGKDVTTGSNNSWNSIIGGRANVLQGDSYAGTVTGGSHSGVLFASGITPGFSPVVSGVGSAVVSADPGDGTEVAPSFASARGLGARAWLENMDCHGASWPGGESPTEGTTADITTTSVWAETQDCRIRLNNFNVNAGSTENLWLDQQEGLRPWAISDSVWHLQGSVICADRNLDYGGQADHVWHAFDVDHVVAIHVGASGDAAIFNSSGVVDADDSVALTKTAYSDGGGTYIDVTATLEARDGTASLDAGWDIEVTADATGRTNSGAVNCSAMIAANIIMEAN